MKRASDKGLRPFCLGDRVLHYTDSGGAVHYPVHMELASQGGRGDRFWPVSIPLDPRIPSHVVVTQEDIDEGRAQVALMSTPERHVAALLALARTTGASLAHRRVASTWDSTCSYGDPVPGQNTGTLYEAQWLDGTARPHKELMLMLGLPVRWTDERRVRSMEVWCHDWLTAKNGSTGCGIVIATFRPEGGRLQRKLPHLATGGQQWVDRREVFPGDERYDPELLGVGLFA